MADTKKRQEGRKVRKARIRRSFTRSSDRPRLCVYRSSRHMYAQIVDDVTNKTLVSASTISKELKGSVKKTATAEAAAKVGQEIARKAKAQNISKVVFDRSGYLYHGRVKALADAARAGGLAF